MTEPAQPTPTQLLADGRWVRIRAATDRDGDRIRALFDGLGQESAEARFMGAPPSQSLLRRLAVVESGPGHACVLAEAVATPGEVVATPGEVVAEARCVPTGPDVAELAVVVRDDHQGVGLGRMMLAALIERARSIGLTRLAATVSLRNTPMLRLLAGYGWAQTEPPEAAVTVVEISTLGGMPGWPIEHRARRVLIEGGGWLDSPSVARLRTAGDDVRRCLGPRRRPDHCCPLVTDGDCPLAEQADVIVPLLTEDAECTAVIEEHRRRWPDRVTDLDPS
jgi:acetyltransferase